MTRGPAGTAWRLVDNVGAPLSAVDQMVADVSLLGSVVRGAPPVLRLYTWGRPALSLGRFQPESDVDHEACTVRGVEVVARPTGGRALLHGGDLTYAVALARPHGTAGSVDAVYRFIAGGLIAGLRRLGVESEVAQACVQVGGGDGPACFAGQQGADIRVGTRKVCGSAQLNRNGAILQHGSILLRRLAFDETDVLTGDHDGARLREVSVTLDELGARSDPASVAAAVVAGFADALDVRFTSTPPALVAPARAPAKVHRSR